MMVGGGVAGSGRNTMAAVRSPKFGANLLTSTCDFLPYLGHPIAWTSIVFVDSRFLVTIQLYL